MEFIDEILDNQDNYEKSAIIQNEREIIYRDLKNLCYAMREVILSQGIKRNDRVLIYYKKSIEVIISLFGCLKSGATYIPADYELPCDRFEYLVNNCSPVLIITDSEGIEKVRDIISKYNIKVLIMDDYRYESRYFRKDLSGIINWQGLPAGEDEECGKKAVEKYAEDIAYIIYTSGSTGNPKGVMIRQDSLRAFIVAISKHIGYSGSTKLLNVMPFSFDGSLVDIYCTLMAGGTMVLMDKFILPSELVKAMDEYEITHICLVSSVVKLLVSRFSGIRRYRLPALKTIWFGGEACPVEVIRTLKELFPNLSFIHTYGPTEATCVTHIYTFDNIPEHPADFFPIGKPLSTVKAYVLDDENRPVKPGEIGELHIGGIQVMEGYCRDEIKTGEVLVEDLLNPGEKLYKTGDYVTVDNEGNYIFGGRKDDMVKSSGYLVHLSEIEKTILAVSGIKDAIILHSEDELSITRLHAAVVLEDNISLSVEEIKAYMQTKLPQYMVPNNIEFLEDGTIPKNPSGKTDKKELAKMMGL